LTGARIKKRREDFEARYAVLSEDEGRVRGVGLHLSCFYDIGCW